MAKDGGVGIIARSLLRGGFASLAIAMGVKGAVLDTDAVVSVSVQEVVVGAPASFAQDEQRLTGDAAFPLTAATSLASTRLEGTVNAFGQGVSRFHDPDRHTGENPEELSLEVACFSNDDNTAYRLNASVTEARRIALSNGSADQGSPFNGVFAQDVRSRLFLSGAIIAWANNPPSDATDDAGATDLAATVSVRVSRSSAVDELAASDVGDDILFESTIRLVPEPDDGWTAAVDGPIVVEPITVEDLTLLGMEAETAAIVQSLQSNGRFSMFAIPMQDHAYLYPATADQPFDLTAELNLEARTPAGGGGVAVTLGDPFTELAAMISQALPDLDGESLEGALNARMARVASDAPAQPARPARVGSVCGVMGVELLAIAGLFFARASGGRGRLDRSGKPSRLEVD